MVKNIGIPTSMYPWGGGVAISIYPVSGRALRLGGWEVLSAKQALAKKSKKNRAHPPPFCAKIRVLVLELGIKLLVEFFPAEPVSRGL